MEVHQSCSPVLYAPVGRVMRLLPCLDTPGEIRLNTPCCYGKIKQPRFKYYSTPVAHSAYYSYPFSMVAVSLWSEYTATLSRGNVWPPQLIAETQGDVSEEVTHALKQVSVGLGFLAYDRFPTWQQVTFIQELRRKQAYEGIDRVVLTPSECHILEHVASIVHLPFETTQTTF